MMERAFKIIVGSKVHNDFKSWWIIESVEDYLLKQLALELKGSK